MSAPTCSNVAVHAAHLFGARRQWQCDGVQACAICAQPLPAKDAEPTSPWRARVRWVADTEAHMGCAADREYEHARDEGRR